MKLKVPVRELNDADVRAYLVQLLKWQNRAQDALVDIDARLTALEEKECGCATQCVE